MPSEPTLQLVLLFLAGIAGGFGSSAPLGPINLWIADTLLDSPAAKLRAFLSGVIACDAGYALLACWGYYQFLEDSTAGRVLGIAGGVFLVSLGVVAMRKQSLREGDVKKAALSTGNPLRDFCVGAFMVASNPGFLMFWMFVIEVLEHQLALHVVGGGAGFFVAGIVLGDFLWFSLLRYLVQRGRESFQTRWLRFLRVGIAAAFVVCGIVTVLHNGQALHTWPSGELEPHEDDDHRIK